MTILNTFQTNSDISFVIPGAISCICFVIFVVISVGMAIGGECDWWKVTLLALFAGAITFVSFYVVLKPAKTRIHAIISEDYPASELLSKYKVISHEGDLWTLEVLQDRNE